MQRLTNKHAAPWASAAEADSWGGSGNAGTMQGSTGWPGGGRAHQLPLVIQVILGLVVAGVLGPLLVTAEVEGVVQAQLPMHCSGPNLPQLL